MPVKTRSIEERIWRHIVKQSDGCWVYTSKNGARYGLIGTGGRGGKQVYVHRWSYEHHVGSIPEGMEVCHTCDMTRCINPDHLFVGTRKDNMQDCLSKGRWGATGPKVGTGAKSSLTKAKVLEIKEKYGAGVSQQKLAECYGIGQSTISRILRNKSCQNL